MEKMEYQMFLQNLKKVYLSICDKSISAFIYTTKHKSKSLSVCIHFQTLFDTHLNFSINLKHVYFDGNVTINLKRNIKSLRTSYSY